MHLANLCVYFILIFVFDVNAKRNRETDDNKDYKYEDDDEYEDYEVEYQDSEKQNSTMEPIFLGSTLFDTNRHTKRCFSKEDVALLSARKQFEVDQLQHSCSI